jgi:hypothetical protein
MWNSLAPLLLQIGAPALVCLILLLGALSHPQQTTYWIGRLLVLFGWASSGVARRSLASRLESRINLFSVHAHEAVEHIDSSGAKIAWATQGHDVGSVLGEDGDVVIYLNPSRPEGENLSRAALMYVSRGFLPRAKLYMTTRQKQSMDLYVTGKLLDEAKSDFASEFFAMFMAPATMDDEKLAALVEAYDLMDRAGLFFPVFVQELVFMGQKVALGGGRKAVEQEVRQLLTFLRSRADRVLGDDTVPMRYEGQYCKCGLVIVAKAEKLAQEGPEPYVRRVVQYADQGFENVYVIGNAETADSIDAIVSEAEARTRLIQVVRRRYKAQVQVRPGQWRPSESLLILLRSSSVQRYIAKPKQAVLEADSR